MNKPTKVIANATRKKYLADIYPEKLVFDGFNYRTTRINQAVRLIYNMDAAFKENKNGTNDNFSHLSHQVTPMVQFSNLFLMDLRSLANLVAV